MISAEDYNISDLAAVLYDSITPAQEIPPAAPEQTDLMWWCVSLARPMDGWWAITQDNWESILDPYETPTEALGWLAQFDGTVIEPSWTEQEIRDAIARPDGFARGTPAAMMDAARRTLTGNKYVLLVERFGGNAYHIFMRTLDAETPDEAATRAAILSKKPAGLILDYEATSVQTFFQLDADHASFASVDGEYNSFAELLSDV